MRVSDFEELAQHQGEAARLEFLYGKLGVKAVPDGDHREIVRWLARRILPLRDELWLYPEVDMKVESYRKGRARADAVLAPDGVYQGQGDWVDPESALMVVEVTSYDSDTTRRDRIEKPKAYAEAGIPVYLLIDRDTCETVVYSRPYNGVYSMTVRLPFGEPLELPSPVGITLDTQPLKDLVR
ncbi:Uma2 family endonuclease [Nocardia jejuensis]|uniref:Uma2 family endonuclease n=1 Tax=Nocardia jejuensis TaxID=328049 RepID=UPI0008352B08|nr:Uma2 family endonuclease [Nocardia jejuensis]